MKRLVAMILVGGALLAGCAEDSPAELDDSARLGGGGDGAIMDGDAGALPAGDAGIQLGADAGGDAAPAAADASQSVQDAAGQMPADAGAWQPPHDAAAPVDATTQVDAAGHMSYDAGAPFLGRACTTAADCADPFYVFENSAQVLITLPRPGHDAAEEQPLCEMRPGGATKTCSFYCTAQTGAGSATYPDQQRWCSELSGHCLAAGAGTACFK